MQTTYQNTHFLKEFGRNDFKPIDIPNDISQSVKYARSQTPIYFQPLRFTACLSAFRNFFLNCTSSKLLLFDNFECIDEGVLMGKVSREVIEQMPKAN